MIPQVRAWRFTATDRRKWIVYAPNKKLALLNFRGAGMYMGVMTIARWPQEDGGPIPIYSVRRLIPESV